MTDYSVQEIVEIFVTKHHDLYLKMNEVDHAYGGWKPNPFHLEGSIWTHTCMVLKEAQFGSTVAKLSALCHDLGKPFVYQENDEKERRRFSSHEAVSTFYAKEILESFDVTDEIKRRVLYVVANHGSMYNFFEDGGIPKQNRAKLKAKFSYKEFADLVEFYKCDHEGRFFIGADTDRCNPAVYKDFDIILADLASESLLVTLPPVIEKTLTCLIGPPRVGKSSWTLVNRKGEIILSRDFLVESRGTGKTYSEKWASLTPEIQKEIDKELQEQFRDALKDNEDIIVDMTNMSKKARKKWLANARGYHTKAKVFIESKSCLLSRNTTDKYIPEYVLDNMMKNFVWPLADEFDHVELV